MARRSSDSPDLKPISRGTKGCGKAHGGAELELEHRLSKSQSFEAGPGLAIGCGIQEVIAVFGSDVDWNFHMVGPFGWLLSLWFLRRHGG